MLQEIVSATIISLYVSTLATILSSFFAMPISYLISQKEFRLKSLIRTILYSTIPIPTTVVGLLVYTIFSETPLEVLDLLYTPYVMILGQAILIFPILSALSLTNFEKAREKIDITAKSLGIRGYRYFLLLINEFRESFIGVMLTGFGRAISEVGVAMMLGGNIKFYTRTITTTILTEYSKGRFLLCLYLCGILLVISVFVNLFVSKLVKWK